MYTRKLIASFVVAIGVAGAGVAAAAVGSEGDSAPTEADTTTTTVVTEPPTTTVAPTTSLTPASAVDSSSSDGVARSTEGCGGETYANHGAYVSSVAHDSDRQPGDVAAAAQSACGKPVTAVDDPESEQDAPDPADSEGTHPSPSTEHGNGKASSHG